MIKRLICLAAAFGMMITLAACKQSGDKKAGNSSDSVSSSSASGQTSSGESMSNTSGTTVSSGSKAINSATASNANSAGTSSRRTVSYIPDPVTTNTVAISGNKVIQTVKLVGVTQVFTFTFTNSKVSSCKLIATCNSEEEAQRFYQNLYGSNQYVKMYDNLEVKGKVVTASYSATMLKEYASYSQNSLKTYLEGQIYQ